MKSEISIQELDKLIEMLKDDNRYCACLENAFNGHWTHFDITLEEVNDILNILIRVKIELVNSY